GTGTVRVDGIGTSTVIFNSADATVFVGTGTLTAIQRGLTLENETAKDAIIIDDAEDSVGQTFNMFTDPEVGEETGHTFENRTGTAMTGRIAWDNSDTSGVSVLGGDGGNFFKVFDTNVPTAISNSANATIDVGDGGNAATSILGALSLENVGGSDKITIFDA